MTNTSYCVGVVLIFCVLAAAPGALAQGVREVQPGDPREDLSETLDGGPSCDAPAEIPTAPFADNGNSCGEPNNAVDYNNFGSGGPCNTVQYPGPDVVYRFVVEDGAQITATLTPTAPADMAIIVATDCDNPMSCIDFEDQIGGGAVSQVALTDLAAGDYFVWIDSYYTAGSQSCGDYLLTVDGDVPAELIEFSVE